MSADGVSGVMTKICSLIPFRSGSAGLVDKNIRLINDIPLFDYSVRFSDAINIPHFISTDYSEQYIRSIATARGAFISRPNELCTDTALMADVILHACKRMDRAGYEFCLLLQPTTPVRNIETFRELLEVFKRNKMQGIALTVQKAEQKILKSGFIDDNRLINITGDNSLFFANRQNLPAVYSPDGCMYLFGIKEFLSRGGFDGEHLSPVINSMVAIDIDTEADLVRCESLMKKFHSDGDFARFL